MTNTKRPYTGFDKIGKAPHPAAAKLMELLQRRWNMSNMGLLNVRLMRSAPAGTKPDDPKWLSVHATGRAGDTGAPGTGKAQQALLREVFDYLVANADELYLEEVHDYSFGGPDGWGRGYRCSRADNKEHGVKVWTATDNGGSRHGCWIHFEVSPDADPTKLEAWFRAHK